MKYHLTNMIGDAGEHLVAARVIKLFGYPCRLINIDIGIDAEIEILDSNYKSTGEFLRCQIKTTTNEAMSIYVDDVHIEYWNRINTPVILLLVHLKSEKIYWHSIDDISKYRKVKTAYVIDFDKTNILKKSNKEKFKELAFYKTVKQIRIFYDEAYDIALEDKNYLDIGNYDLTTFEEFVYHSNKILYDFKKIEALIHKNPVLRKVSIEYEEKLEFINEYLSEVSEIKEQVLIEYGSDYYDHLQSDNWDWD